MNFSALISQLLSNASRLAATTYLDFTFDLTFQKQIATAAVDRIHAISTYDDSLTGCCSARLAERHMRLQNVSHCLPKFV